MDAQRADVVVVGGSPAGLAAARAAAETGARVVLLESKRALGDPEGPATLAFDFLWTASERPPESTVRRRLLGVKLRSPCNAAHSLEVDAPLSILDRAAYDRHLGERAQRAGAEIALGVEDVRILADRTVLSRDARWAPKVLVFADGADTLARAFLRPTRDPEALAWGVSLAVRAEGADREGFVAITPGSHAPGGRMQANPVTGDAWTHWTFTRGPRAEAVERARAALALEARFRGWPASVAKEATVAAVAPDPVYTIPHQLVANGIMVVGGAAGQGGLEMGVASGEQAGAIAGLAALEGRARRADLAVYSRAWKRRHLRGYRALRRASDRVGRLSDAQLDRLLAPWAGWRVPARDLVGLAHPSFPRRAEAVAKLVARNPWAAPQSALLGLRALLPSRFRARS